MNEALWHRATKKKWRAVWNATQATKRRRKLYWIRTSNRWISKQLKAQFSK